MTVTSRRYKCHKFLVVCLKAMLNDENAGRFIRKIKCFFLASFSFSIPMDFHNNDQNGSNDVDYVKNWKTTVSCGALAYATTQDSTNKIDVKLCITWLLLMLLSLLLFPFFPLVPFSFWNGKYIDVVHVCGTKNCVYQPK